MRILRKVVICVTVFTILLLNISSESYSKSSSNKKEIIIDIPSRKLFLLENSRILKEYPVAVGKSDTQTPIGQYRVISKLINPYYRKNNIAGGSIYNPLGTRWLGFKLYYGIHGNSNPASIGTFASAGCVRMYERDVQELYDVVSYYESVNIQYELLKVERDVDGENPILIVYPDYYSMEENIADKIEKKLTELGIYNQIKKERLAKLINQSNKEKTIFSSKYTYFVNNKYVTNDILYADDMFYINKRKFEKFFCIELPSIYGENKCVYGGQKIYEIVVENKKYISYIDIEKIIGGKHKYNINDQSIEYSLENYILLNNTLVLGLGYDLINSPIVPIKNLIKPLDIDIQISKNTTKLTYKGEEIKYSYHNDEAYAQLNDIVETFGITANIHTSGRYLELFSDPLIIYNDSIYKGKIHDNELYVSYSIISNVFNINECNVFGINSSSLIYNEYGFPYIKFSDLDDYKIINSDIYNTKIYIEKKSL